MIKFEFDAELTGSDGDTIPVYCEIQTPFVGGQSALINLAVPAQYVRQDPPRNPCSLIGKSGDMEFDLRGVHWRSFPTSAKGILSLEKIELLHVETLTVRRSSMRENNEIRFYLGPVSYLVAESSFVRFNESTNSAELFALDFPGFGTVRFVMEWVTIYNRNSDMLGATVIAGFSAVADLASGPPIDIERRVSKFRKSLEILAVLFRQAVSLHGWTYSDDKMVTTWVASIKPNITPSAREERGDFLASPTMFLECATNLVQAYEKADEKIHSLVRHLSLAINPHNHLRDGDHFLFMFSAFERVIDFAWKRDRTPHSVSATTLLLIKHLEELKKNVTESNDVNASTVAARIGGLVTVVSRPSIQDKLIAFLRVYPAMQHYSQDLWPILGSEKERGLREVRHLLAHGSSSFVSLNVIAVAKWHLAILLERVIFILLEIPVPDAICPRSYLLQQGGKGWYERDWWEPLQSEPNLPI